MYCDEGFTGPLCGQSIASYYIDWTTRDSLSCRSDIVLNPSVLGIVLSLPLILLLPLFICCAVGRKYSAIKKVTYAAIKAVEVIKL